MSFLGNVIWLVCGGVFVGAGYFFFALVFFPLFPFLWPLVKYSFAPFGKGVVRQADLNRYKKREDEDADLGFAKSSALVRFLANVLWVFTAGIVMASLHLLAGLLNLGACILLITIPVALPNAMAHFQLIGPAFRPFGMVVVQSELAKEIKIGAEKGKLGI